MLEAFVKLLAGYQVLGLVEFVDQNTLSSIQLRRHDRGEDKIPSLIGIK
jgi:hypothetical protein